jgi:hypothetical protein
MTRHKLSKADLLDYALEGALTRKGLQDDSQGAYDDYYEELEKDIAEIERRIKLVEIAERKKS